MMHSLIAPTAAILAKSGGGGITLDPIAKPIAAVLAVFYSLVPNYGVAIVLLTIAVMIILTPLTIKQTRSMLVMQKLQPELKKLQAEHKNDRQALNEAVMALYKEHNASPLGGCLPMLLPFPVFFALFRVLEGLSRMVQPLDPTIGHKVPWPKYLNPNTQMWKDIAHHGGTLKAFGMDLSKSAVSVKGGFLTSLPFFVLLLLMIGTQYYQQRQLTSRNPQAAQGQQAQIMKFFPLIFGVISIRFPAGVVVYWTVSNIIRIFQQWAMYRYDPKVKALVEADVKEVEAKTREIDAKPPAARPRFRDLLSGAATAGGADPRGAKPGTGKNGGAKSPGRPTNQRGGKTPTGAKPSPGAKPPLRGKATPPTAKAKPATPKAKPAPPSAKAGPTGTDRPDPTGSDKNGGGKQVRDGAAAPGSDRSSGAGGAPSNGANRAGIGADDVPPTTAPTDRAGPKNGTPGGRTGAGGARTGGTRGKRSRRGR